MDSLEGLIGLLWLMFFVGSVVRAIAQGKRRAEQEAARRATRRGAGLPHGMPVPRKQVLRPGWPVYPGQPAQPVIMVEQGEGQEKRQGQGEAEGEVGAEGEGESIEGDDRDMQRRLKQERSEEWQSDKARLWEMPADAGSLGALGEPADEPIVKSADASGLSGEWDMVDWVLDMDTGAGAGEDVAAAQRIDGASEVWKLSGRVEPDHALLGIVWGTVLGQPRCRLTGNRR